MGSEKLKKVRSILRESSEESDISIGWIPGYIGVKRNEEVNKAANEAREKDQKEVEID